MYSPIEFVNASMDELGAYKKALLETEYKIMDWLKRIDQKETEAFIEIAKNVEMYQTYNGEPLKDGFQFERFAAGILTWNGFTNVTVTPKTNDFGGDVLAEKEGIKFVFQCKYYTLPVGVEAVQQVFAAKIHYSCHVAVVITNSVFTKAASILAEESGVLLWGGDKFRIMIDNAKKMMNNKG